MRRLRFAMVCAALLVVAGTAPAFAASADGHPQTVVIGGRHFGPKDGVRVDTQQFVVTHGSGPINVTFGGSGSAGAGSIAPMTTTAWGTSYAISNEWWSQLGYDGFAKAAGNVYGTQRIIQVCIWYTRGGSQVGTKVCSNSDDPNGVWLAGPEVKTSVWDSLNPFDPQTIFNISTVRIDPRIR